VTAVLPQRVPAGTVDAKGRRGGQFAPAAAAPSACASVYAALDAWAAAREPEDGEVIAEEGARVTLHRPVCPHGSFRRWADAVAPGCKVQRNCRACHPPRRGLTRHREE
jgi:hypothetical protein